MARPARATPSSGKSTSDAGPDAPIAGPDAGNSAGCTVLLSCSTPLENLESPALEMRLKDGVLEERGICERLEVLLALGHPLLLSANARCANESNRTMVSWPAFSTH